MLTKPPIPYDLCVSLLSDREIVSKVCLELYYLPSAQWRCKNTEQAAADISSMSAVRYNRRQRSEVEPIKRGAVLYMYIRGVHDFAKV